MGETSHETHGQPEYGQDIDGPLLKQGEGRHLGTGAERPASAAGPAGTATGITPLIYASPSSIQDRTKRFLVVPDPPCDLLEQDLAAFFRRPARGPGDPGIIRKVTPDICRPIFGHAAHRHAFPRYSGAGLRKCEERKTVLRTAADIVDLPGIGAHIV